MPELDPLTALTSGGTEDESDPNRTALKNPRVKQFLDKIGQSEGADYNTLVGGTRIDDLSHHPNKIGLRTSAGPSTAFGRYQIVGSTDRSKLRKYQHLDYSPENQDLRAVELLRQTGALSALEAGDEPTAIQRAGREWASLPGSTLPGRKNYRAFGQTAPQQSPQRRRVQPTEVDPLTALTQGGPTSTETTPEVDPLTALTSSGQTQPAKQTKLNRVNQPNQTATATPVGSRQPSVPIEQALRNIGTNLDADIKRRTRGIKPTNMLELPATMNVGGRQIPTAEPQAQQNVSTPDQLASGLTRHRQTPIFTRTITPEQQVRAQEQGQELPNADLRAQITEQMRSQAMRQRGGGVMPKPDEIEAAVQQELGRRNAEDAQRIKDAPALNRLVPQYRDLIRGSASLAGMHGNAGPTKWTSEAITAGTSGLAESLTAGMKALGNKWLSPAGALLTDQQKSDQLAETLRLHAAAMAQAAQEEGADRNFASKMAQQVVSGTIASTPELAAMTVGLPAPLAFGLGGASRAYGRGESAEKIIKAGEHGTLQGAAFEVPALAGLKNPFIKAGTVGLGTGAVDLAAGATPAQALQGGVTNAFMSSLGAHEREPVDYSANGIRTGAANKAVSPEIEAQLRAGAEKAGVSEQAVNQAVQPEPVNEPLLAQPKPSTVGVSLPTQQEKREWGNAYRQEDDGSFTFGHKKTPLVRNPSFDPKHTIDVVDTATGGGLVKVTPYEMDKRAAKILEEEGRDPAEYVKVIHSDGAWDLVHENDIVWPNQREQSQPKAPMAETQNVGATTEPQQPVVAPTEERRGPQRVKQADWLDMSEAEREKIRQGLAIEQEYGRPEGKPPVIDIHGQQNVGEAGQEPRLTRPASPTEVAKPKEAEVVRPWEMTKGQIEEEFQRRKSEDSNIEASIFGPELAKKYERLQRTANSSTATAERMDAASAEIERMEAALSERDRNRLYGIGEEGTPQLDELRDYRQSLGNLDDHDPQSLAQSMRWAVSRVGKETDPAKMTHEQRVAYGTLREAARIAHENGWDTQAISREAIRAAGERFSDPEDAAFMLDRFIKKEPTATKPEVKQLAAPTEQKGENKPLKLAGGFADASAPNRIARQRIMDLGEVNPLNPRESIIDGVKFSVRTEAMQPNELYLDIESVQRGKGNASRVLDQILAAAKEEGVDIVGVPKAFGRGGLSTAQLKEWYARHGFEPYRGDMIIKRAEAEQKGEPPTEPLAAQTPKSQATQLSDNEPLKYQSWITRGRAREVTGVDEPHGALLWDNRAKLNKQELQGLRAERQSIIDDQEQRKKIIRQQDRQGTERDRKLGISHQASGSGGEIADINKYQESTKRQVAEIDRLLRKPSTQAAGVTQAAPSISEGTTREYAGKTYTRQGDKWIRADGRPVFGERERELNAMDVPAEPVTTEPTKQAETPRAATPELQRHADAAAALRAQGAEEGLTSIERAAFERKAARLDKKAQGERLQRAGADPYELLDDIIIHGGKLIRQGVTAFDEWSKRIKAELGPETEEHLNHVWAQLHGKEAEPQVEREPSTTAVKNASMEADRAARDLPELVQAEPRKAAEVHQRALDANAKDARSVDRLTEQALNTDKNFTDVETAQVRLRAQEIKNRESELLKEIAATNDPQAIQEKRLELNSLTDEFDRLSQATKKAGTEWGRAGVARQQAIDQDFSLVAMKARVKAAKGDALTPKQNEQIEELHAKITKAEAERDAANERAAKAILDRQIQRAARQRSRTETKASLDQEAVVIKQNIAAELARLKSQASQIHSMGGLGNLDPEGTLTKELIKYVHNRAKANIGLKAEALIDDAHELVKDLGVSRRQVAEALVGYGGEPKKRVADANRLAQVRTEIKSLLQQEDIAEGRRSTRQEGPKRDFTKNQTRLKQLQNQEIELERKMRVGDFEKKERIPPKYTRETYEAERRVNQLKMDFEKMKYRATRSTMGKLGDTAIGVGNVPKTLLSMGDLSALLRQGGIGVVQHPVLSAQAARDMLTSFTKHGFANVENAIKEAKNENGASLYELAKKHGLEFTGVDMDNPKLNHKEEGYLGGNVIDTAAKGKYNPIKAVKVVKDFSERTFVSFLDSQRMRIFEQQEKALRDMGLKGKEFDAALKAQAGYINIITGRGSLGTEGNKLAPAMNLAMFSPRLVASRFQFLNKMVNPVAWARMPKGARKLQMTDNIKFLAGTAAVLGLAKAAGASVGTDPDDADFLKIKVGNTRFDTLTGLQQPMRFMIRMARAMKGGETYSGDPKGKIFMDFVRSKASPEVGLGWDYLAGSNRLSGKKFEPVKDIRDTLIPLPVQDFRDAIKEDGALRGSLEALPSIFGVGTQTYKGAAEKPTTQAEKLARRFIQNKLPDEARDQEQIDTDQQRAQLRARARKGEDVSGDIAALGAKITERQTKAILAARNKSRLQEDVNRLGPREAIIVYSTATPAQQAEIKDLLQKKSPIIDTLPPDIQADVRKRYEAAGFTQGPLPRERQERKERTERKSRERQGYLAPP